MSNPTRNHYCQLTISAATASTEIWVSDEYGHLVQKATGRLNTSLLRSDYFVEFKLGGPVYSICLDCDKMVTESEIVRDPPCLRPKLKLFDGDWIDYYGGKPDVL